MRYSVSTKDFDRGVFDPQVGCWWMRQNIVAFTGLCQVRAERDEYFGGSASRPFRSKVLLNPTWRQLYAIARQQQKATGDVQHDFFEGYYDTGMDDMMIHPRRLPVRIIHLSLGS
jgi:hypothetical protein